MKKYICIIYLAVSMSFTSGCVDSKKVHTFDNDAWIQEQVINGTMTPEEAVEYQQQLTYED